MGKPNKVFCDLVMKVLADANDVSLNVYRQPPENILARLRCNPLLQLTCSDEEADAKIMQALEYLEGQRLLELKKEERAGMTLWTITLVDRVNEEC